MVRDVHYYIDLSAYFAKYDEHHITLAISLYFLVTFTFYLIVNAFSIGGVYANMTDTTLVFNVSMSCFWSTDFGTKYIVCLLSY